MSIFFFFFRDWCVPCPCHVHVVVSVPVHCSSILTLPMSSTFNSTSFIFSNAKVHIVSSSISTRLAIAFFNHHPRSIISRCWVIIRIRPLYHIFCLIFFQFSRTKHVCIAISSIESANIIQVLNDIISSSPSIENLGTKGLSDPRQTNSYYSQCTVMNSKFRVPCLHLKITSHYRPRIIQESIEMCWF